jgi:hypothetical protein
MTEDDGWALARAPLHRLTQWKRELDGAVQRFEADFDAAPTFAWVHPSMLARMDVVARRRHGGRLSREVALAHFDLRLETHPDLPEGWVQLVAPPEHWWLPWHERRWRRARRVELA